MLQGLFSHRPSAAQRYVQRALAEPEAEDVTWLTSVATEGDRDRASWELRYLRRALAMLVAQRDALDDRTASAVAHEIASAIQSDRQVAAAMVKVAERQFNERLSAYREMMALRGLADAPGERVARTLLLLSGCARVDSDQVARGAAIVDRWMTEAAADLLTSFGEARLPAGPTPEGHTG